MFGLSWGELFVIGIIGLIVFGPDELPRLAKTLNQLFRGFQRQGDDLRREFYNAVYQPAEEIRKEISQTLTTTIADPLPPHQSTDAIDPHLTHNPDHDPQPVDDQHHPSTTSQADESEAKPK